MLGLLHRRIYLSVREVLVTNHIDFANLHLLSLVNVDDHIDIVLTDGIGHLLNVNSHIIEALFVVEILDDARCLGQQMLGGDVASRQVDLVADIVSLAFLDAF